MGFRLSKIYTRTGDKGTTGLGDGSRVNKDHAQIEAIGTVDELNSVLGLMLTEPVPEDLAEIFVEIQHKLFDLGAELSLPPGSHRLIAGDIDRLEVLLDRYNESLAPLKDFILPGGSKAGALCHLARTVCRRAERTLVSLNAIRPVSETSLSYLNRLSDLLFVLARILNKRDGCADVLWQPSQPES